VRDRGRESLTVKTIASSKGIALACISFLILASPAQAQRGFLPPEEFDHPFDGSLRVVRLQTQQEVRQNCPNMTFILPVASGCSVKWKSLPRLCYVFMVSDDEIKAAGYDPEIVLRHEIGHCNGWPSDHKGAR
jgi:hypothetical protein